MDEDDMQGPAKKASSKHASAFFERMDERGYDYVQVCFLLDVTGGAGRATAGNNPGALVGPLTSTVPT